MLEVDYIITGNQPFNVDFKAVQNEAELKYIKKNRDSQATIESKSRSKIELCWKKFDRKTKKLDFSVKRNMEFHTDKAKTGTLESINDDFLLIEEEIQ